VQIFVPRIFLSSFFYFKEAEHVRTILGAQKNTTYIPERGIRTEELKMEKTSLGRRMSGRFSTRQIATIGMLSAISIVLGLSGYGFIPLPTAKATIMHIPIIIGAILEGPAVGVMIGLIFGLFSIMQNLTVPTLLSFAFINPLVSVLPRVLIGIAAYYTYYFTYRYFFKKREYISVALGAATGTLTNTIGVLGMIYLIYVAEFAAARGISMEAAAAGIYAIALVNGLPEIIVSMVICTPVIMMLKKRKG
jgi:uncharacterized membrane protein